MKCPQCGSTHVYVMVYQTPKAQMACKVCNKSGTFYEFGLHLVQNIGLVTQYDEPAAFHLEHDMMDASDPSFTVALTVHQFGNQSACNVWVRLYDQWLKFIPERVTEYAASPDMLHGEVIRILQSSKGVEVTQDFRWRMALIALQQDAIAMGKK